MENSIKIPTGVRVIALLNYISSILGILSLLFMFLILKGPMMIIAGIFTVPIIIGSLLTFLIGRGLYRAKNWARVLLIVLGIISLILSLLSVGKGGVGVIVGIVINILITGYLLFNKNVKAAFVKKAVPTVPPQASMPM